MNKKRLIAALSAVAVIATLFAGCTGSSDSGDKKEDSNKKASDIKVGMATDQGGLGDKSFNDSAYEGLQEIQKEYGIKPTVLQSKQQENYEPNLKNLGKDCDITFAVGAMMKDSAEKVAKDMPDKNFALIDEVSDLPNIKSLTFKEQEGSFLMGVIAGSMTKTNKVGFIGGMDIPTIQRFEAGYAAGVKAVNPAAAEGLINDTTVKYAGNFTDSNKGYELAKALYNDGCDVIFHAAGAVGLGMFKAAKETGNWAIGVDQDQAESVPEYKDVILSSMIKKVDVATYDATKEVIEGTFKAGKGNEMVLGLKEGGVDMALTTKNNTPEDVIKLAEKYKQAIIDGKIKVPDTPEEVKEFKAPQI